MSKVDFAIKYGPKCVRDKIKSGACRPTLMYDIVHTHKGDHAAMLRLLSMSLRDAKIELRATAKVKLRVQLKPPNKQRNLVGAMISAQRKEL